MFSLGTMESHYQGDGMCESTVKMMYYICQLVNNIVVIVQQEEEENRQQDGHFQSMMNNMCDQWLSQIQVLIRFKVTNQ